MKLLRALVAGVAVVLLATGCTSCSGSGAESGTMAPAEGQPDTGGSAPTNGLPATPTGPPPPPVVPRPGEAATTLPEFNADRAFVDLRTQMAMGDRSPGSQGHALLREFLISELTERADRVLKQDFRATTDFGGPYDFTNIIATFSEASPGNSLLIGAHWDTRPVSDRDPFMANRSKPCPGANDGASGVAVLLELARVFKNHPPQFPVYLLFIDAEDSGKTGSSRPWSGFCLGSQQFADEMDSLRLRPSQAIIIDMIGDADLEIKVEQNSNQVNKRLNDIVFEEAAKLGHDGFHKVPGPAMIDDHMPLIQQGVPAIDLIDFDYPYWHTVEDTIEHCSADSLRQVGETLVAVIYRGLK